MTRAVEQGDDVVHWTYPLWLDKTKTAGIGAGNECELHQPLGSYLAFRQGSRE